MSAGSKKNKPLETVGVILWILLAIACAPITVVLLAIYLISLRREFSFLRRAGFRYVKGVDEFTKMFVLDNLMINIEDYYRDAEYYIRLSYDYPSDRIGALLYETGLGDASERDKLRSEHESHKFSEKIADGFYDMFVKGQKRFLREHLEQILARRNGQT